MADGFGTFEVTVEVGIWNMISSVTVRHSNKELLSVSIWINDAQFERQFNGDHTPLVNIAHRT
jgi:hypothetical protein